jgi:uncharacterized protein YndB with AHSA1/START domain
LSEAKSIIVERLMPHARKKIWRALTASHLVAEWLMKNDIVKDQPMRLLSYM